MAGSSGLPAQEPRAPVAAPATQPEGAATAEEMRAAAASINAFAFDLYERLKATDGNLFFSPYSISTALAMTYAGARGNTAAEMRKTLHFDLPDERLHTAFGAHMTALNAPTKDGQARPFEWNVANRLFGQQGLVFLPEFLALTAKRYSAPLEQVDFAKDTEGARKRINAWVEERTRERIKDLIPGGALAADSMLVLTNAVYFKGDWRFQFREQATRPQPFHLADGQSVQAPLMFQKGTFAHAVAGHDLQILKLPYAGDELSMLILLPTKAEGIGVLEAELSPAKLAAWVGALRETEDLHVYLPRFEMTGSTAELSEHLKDMGMTGAFDPRQADFTGMTQERELYITKVLHKAFVEVNEKGTEAAAATAVVMAPTSAQPLTNPLVFRADRPFLFAIRENASGAILFLGRLMNPVAKP